MITAIPKYDKDDNEIGIEDIIDLPALPINTLREEQLRILAALGGDRSKPPAPSSRKKKVVASKTKSGVGGVASLDELVLLLDPTIKKGTDAFASERSRLSHHLKNFESMGLVTKTKSGKNVVVRLTGLGEMFV